MMEKKQKVLLAYVVGVAIGDGNLSNPNGRAIRLRITCDNRYPHLISKIRRAIQTLLPTNKVTVVFRKETYCDISCYSNKWEKWLPWQQGKGSKITQRVRVPKWILKDTAYIHACLRGLFETDGSIYYDRNYLMVGFVTLIPELAHDVMYMLKKIHIQGRCYCIKNSSNTRFNIRVSKNAPYFLKTIELEGKR